MEEVKSGKKDTKNTRKLLEGLINSEINKLHRKIDGSHLENEALDSFDNVKTSFNSPSIQMADFEEALSKKSNKNDIEMILRQIKTMHSHSTMIISNLIESERSLVEASQGDSEQVILNKRANILNNAIIIQN